MLDNKQNEEAQFYSDLLRVFFDSTNDAIFVLCDEMKFLVCNKMMQQWLGLSEKELTEHNNRTPITELLGNQDAVVFFKTSFERALQNKDVIFETQINPVKGKQRWVELNMKRVDIENGDMVIVVARDINDRKIAEVEKERLQRELIQSQKMDALGKLTGGIAHDFNNILGIISGYAEMAMHKHELQHEPIPIKYIENIYNSAERATKLIAQLMAFSRTEKTECKPLQLAPLIEEDIKMFHATMPSSIVFDTSYEDNVPDVLMEPVKLQQLLLNICINAKDAMDGAGKISISLGVLKDVNDECSFCYEKIHGDWVEITIADTGSGIKQEILNQVFDPFFTTKKQGKGSGMGLAMVSGIVESYSGHIIVRTEPGIGTNVHLLFPPADEYSLDETQLNTAAITDEITGHNKSVLIVDDEPDLAGFIEEILTMHGYSCTTKTSSTDAFDLYRSSPDAFDLVITDQTMPDLTGSEMIAKIREIKPEQPIILATGYSETMNSVAAIENDIVFVQKPFNARDLLEIMTGLLKVSND